MEIMRHLPAVADSGIVCHLFNPPESQEFFLLRIVQPVGIIKCPRLDGRLAILCKGGHLVLGADIRPSPSRERHLPDPIAAGMVKTCHVLVMYLRSAAVLVLDEREQQWAVRPIKI